jgi:hypothetical protein
VGWLTEGSKHAKELSVADELTTKEPGARRLTLVDANDISLALKSSRPVWNLSAGFSAPL